MFLKLQQTYYQEFYCVLGTNTGSVSFYDLRIGEKRKVISLLGLKHPVVGLSTFSSLDWDGGNTLVAAGTESGDIRIWDPRMYEVNLVSSVYFLTIVEFLSSLHFCLRLFYIKCFTMFVFYGSL